MAPNPCLPAFFRLPCSCRKVLLGGTSPGTMSGVATSGGGGVTVASLHRHRKLPFPPPPPLQKGYHRLLSKDALRRSAVTCFAMDTSSSGGMGNAPTFRRVRVWDPYKRLGVSKHASEEEIRGARNFLLDQYAWHERSAESIEAAYERIIMASFWKRKKEKINLKTRLRNKVEESPPWFKRLVDFFEWPSTDIVLKRLALFVFLGAWSITNSAQNGPAFQVAISLGACIYFLNDKMKNVARASITGFAALAIGWVCGSILVPVIPSAMIPPTWPLELLTSLVAYVSLFLACTYLK